MIAHAIHMPRERWTILVCMNADPRDAQTIIREMRAMGASHHQQVVAWENLLYRWKPNTGLTATVGRKSVTVISRQTSLREFLNTYAHELNHLEMHIGRACGYDPYSEEASYLSGEMSSRILCKFFGG